ncbi:MAG TPA: isoprenylcysteine carboxylmethyltransferase family protein [Candidatus Binatia bacterium]|nr:isoprenylcysteine carboxylmethyltransferase family protein [Candidatus Binatia bacterium]
MSTSGALAQWFVFAGAVAALILGPAPPGERPALAAWVAAVTLPPLIAFFGIDRGLISERLHPGPGARERLWVAFLVVVPLVVGHVAIARLDVGRFHWSPPMPLVLRVTGVLLLAAGNALAHWAMAVNRFFSSVVRIQHDRGQHVVCDGPYHLVRHPGYAGVMLMLLGSPLALGSWCSIVPNVALGALLVHRTHLEERVLLAEFDGYRAYTTRVPARLLPGVW